MTKTNIHPDDVLLFHEISVAMRRVATAYRLPLRSIAAMPMPERDMIDKLGDCNGSGDIRLVMRATVDDEWCTAPRSPDLVWQTAAHELAHLRFLNHGDGFKVFFLEMREALNNRREDRQQKILDKLVKLQASREGEARIGNAAAAEAFAGMINRMLIEHELSPTDIDYARAADHDPVIEMMVNLENYNIAKKKTRIAWQESLARIVANAHLCRFLVRAGSNDIFFVGTRSHAAVAEYAFGVIVSAADRMATLELYRYGAECFRRDGNWRAKNGFREAWLGSFIERIAERFREARMAAVAGAPEGASTALVRLEGALVRAQAYVDDKFKARRGVASLGMSNGTHAEGKRRGRAAADSMALGRAAVGRGPARLLGDGK